MTRRKRAPEPPPEPTTFYLMAIRASDGMTHLHVHEAETMKTVGWPLCSLPGLARTKASTLKADGPASCLFCAAIHK